MTNYYYKVCEIWSDGSLQSVLAPPRARVQYQIGERTVPHEGCGPLGVFGSKGEAVAYLDCITRHTHKVFECEASNVREPAESGKIMWSLCLYLLADEYRPSGTLLADAVTLTRKLTEEELSS